MASDSRRARLLGRVPVGNRRLVLAVGATVLFALLVFVVLRSGLLSVPTEPTSQVRAVLEDYGLLALFAVFVVEGAMLLYFAPSESLVPAAVLVLGDAPADIAAIVAVAILGATTGQLALFALARRGGREYLLNTRWFHLSEAQLDRFDRWFDRWGPLAVPASNTMLFTRGMLTIPAGLSDMSARTFVLLSALGTLAFETILAALTVGALALLG